MPIPEYRAKINVSSVILQQNNEFAEEEIHSKILGQASDKLYAHMGKTMYIHHNPVRHRDDRHFRKDFALTPEGLLVVYDTIMEGKMLEEQEHTLKTYNMEINIFSFKTPVDSLKQELTDIIIQACAEIKK